MRRGSGSPHPHTRAAPAAAWRRQSTPCGLTAGARPLTLRCADGGARRDRITQRSGEGTGRADLVDAARLRDRHPVPRARHITAGRVSSSRSNAEHRRLGGGAEEREPTGREAGLRLGRGPGAARPRWFPPSITASQRDRHSASTRSNNSAGQISLRGRTRSTDALAAVQMSGRRLGRSAAEAAPSAVTASHG